jgi:hypothetical protein
MVNLKHCRRLAFSGIVAHGLPFLICRATWRPRRKGLAISAHRFSVAVWRLARGWLASVTAGREPRSGASRWKTYAPVATRAAKTTEPLAKFMPGCLSSVAIERPPLLSSWLSVSTALAARHSLVSSLHRAQLLRPPPYAELLTFLSIQYEECRQTFAGEVSFPLSNGFLNPSSPTLYDDYSRHSNDSHQ